LWRKNIPFRRCTFSLFLGVKTHPSLPKIFLFAVISIPFRRYFISIPFRRYFNSFSPLQFLSAVITAFLQSRFGPKIPFRISDLAQKVVTICLSDEGT